MEFLNFPIIALGLALICLIGVSIPALIMRATLRLRNEQLVVARAQAYAMLELSQAGVLFIDRDLKLLGDASAVAPELLGHPCTPGTPFVQVLVDLVSGDTRRAAIDYLDTLWKADPTAIVDATANPLQRVHSRDRHLAIRFSRLVVDGHVHHIIVSVEKISAPRVVPQTIEVPVLNDETFARRLAGETGAHKIVKTPTISDLPILASDASLPSTEPTLGFANKDFSDPTSTLPSTEIVTDAPMTAVAPAVTPAAAESASTPAMAPTIAPVVAPTAAERARKLAQELMSASSSTIVAEAPRLSIDAAGSLGPLDVTEDSLPSVQAPAGVDSRGATSTTLEPLAMPRAAQAAPAASPAFEPRDPRLNAMASEIMPLDPQKLDVFLNEAREKAGQLRGIIRLPAREPQAFREKLVLILELIRGIHSRANHLPLPSVNERAMRFEEALGKLRDRQNLSGNDFLPLAVKLDDLLSHLAMLGEVAARLREWRAQHGGEIKTSNDTVRSPTLTGTTIRQPKLGQTDLQQRGIDSSATATAQQPQLVRGREMKLGGLTRDSLEELGKFLADMYGKRVSVVVVGLEDVPKQYTRTVEKILVQLVHNAIRHGVEMPAERAVEDKPETGTVAVQFARVGADGYQLSVQDDGRGLDHEKIRAVAIKQGVLTPADAASIDPRGLSSLIFRPGFTTATDDGARGLGMDVVRELVTKVGGRVGIATKPGEYTRFRITLPQEKKAANAQVA